MTPIELMNYDMMEHEEVTKERARELEIEEYETSEECLIDHIEFDIQVAISEYCRLVRPSKIDMYRYCDELIDRIFSEEEERIIMEASAELIPQKDLSICERGGACNWPDEHNRGCWQCPEDKEDNI